MANLDISLKGCTDERFNTRYNRHLVANDSSKQAKLRLVGLVMGPAADKPGRVCVHHEYPISNRNRTSRLMSLEASYIGGESRASPSLPSADYVFSAAAVLPFDPRG